MRWISTPAKEYLGRVSSSRAEEVQLSAIGNALYISANQNQHDATLSTLTQSHSTGKAFARALVDTFGEQDTGATNRFSRHTGKLYAEWPVERPSL